MRLLVGDGEDAVVLIAQANFSFLAHEAADHPEKARAYLRAIDEQVERISDALRGFFHQQKISEFLKEPERPGSVIQPPHSSSAGGGNRPDHARGNWILDRWRA